MPNTTITFGRTPLPNVQWTGDADALLDLIATHLTGALVSGALVGQVGGATPSSNIGFYFNNYIWYAWNSIAAAYLPDPVVAGRVYDGVLRLTTLQSGATGANVLLTLPDQDGATLATTKDVLAHNPTATVSGASIAIDTTKNAYTYIVLTANATIGGSAMVDGQQIDLWIENPAGSTFTVTWGAPVTWFGTTPAMSPSPNATTRVIDHYILFKVGNIIFGQYVQGATILTTGGSADTTPPTVTGFIGDASSITLTASEPLRGTAPPLGDFGVVRVVGGSSTALTITSITISGTAIVLAITQSMATGDVVKVTFNGASATIKDLAGNVMASFAQTTVPIVAGTNANNTGGGRFRSGGGGQNLPA